MPRHVTMGSLVSLCKELGDLEGDDHIGDPGWKSRISLVYGDLYEEAALTGYRYFEYSTTITATGAETYNEVTDHFSTVLIARVVDDAGRLAPPLVELNPGEETQYAGLTGNAIGYQLIDDQLYLYPKPDSGTYRWRYIPQPPDLGLYDDDDIVDVVVPAGLNFVAWGAVASAKSKSESDLQFARAEQEKAREKFQVWCANRSIQGARRVQGAIIDDKQKLPGEW